MIRPEAISKAMLHTVATSSMRARVAENRVPTLLVCGTKENDFKEPRTFAEREMPMLEVVDLDAGHAVNIQAAEGFNDAVTDFFRRRTR